MESLLAAAVALAAAHADPMQAAPTREWVYHVAALDLVLTISRTTDGPVWEVVGYEPQGQRVQRLFVVGNRPLSVYFCQSGHDAAVTAAVRALATCRPKGVSL